GSWDWPFATDPSAGNRSTPWSWQLLYPLAAARRRLYRGPGVPAPPPRGLESADPWQPVRLARPCPAQPQWRARRPERGHVLAWRFARRLSLDRGLFSLARLAACLPRFPRSAPRTQRPPPLLRRYGGARTSTTGNAGWEGARRSAHPSSTAE